MSTSNPTIRLGSHSFNVRALLCTGTAVLASAFLLGLAGQRSAPVAAQAIVVGEDCCNRLELTVHTNALKPGASLVPPAQIAWKSAGADSVPMFFEAQYRRDDGGAIATVMGFVDVFGAVHQLGWKIGNQVQSATDWPDPDDTCAECVGLPVIVHNDFLARLKNDTALMCQTGVPATSPCFADVDHFFSICQKLMPTVDHGGINSWRFKSFIYWFEGDNSSQGANGSVDTLLKQVNLPCSTGGDAFHLFQDPSQKKVIDLARWGQEECSQMATNVEDCANIMFVPN